jgi:hypothetical protein
MLWLKATSYTYFLMDVHRFWMYVIEYMWSTTSNLSNRVLASFSSKNSVRISRKLGVAQPGNERFGQIR